MYQRARTRMSETPCSAHQARASETCHQLVQHKKSINFKKILLSKLRKCPTAAVGVAERDTEGMEGLDSNVRKELALF